MGFSFFFFWRNKRFASIAKIDPLFRCNVIPFASVSRIRMDSIRCQRPKHSQNSK